MTEMEAKALKKGDIITYHGEPCEVVKVYRNPVLVECKSVTPNHIQLHMVRPGRVRCV